MKTAKERKRFQQQVPVQILAFAEMTHSQSLKIVGIAMSRGDSDILGALERAVDYDYKNLGEEEKSDCMDLGNHIMEEGFGLDDSGNMPYGGELSRFPGFDPFLDGCALLAASCALYINTGDEDYMMNIADLVGMIVMSSDDRGVETPKESGAANPLVKFAVWCKHAADNLEGLSMVEQSILESIHDGLLEGDYNTIEIINPAGQWSETFENVLSVGLRIFEDSTDNTSRRIVDYINRVLAEGTFE